MGFFAELGQLSKEHQKERHEEGLEAKRAEREHKADEIETAIKNIQARGALAQGQPGALTPDELKRELGEAQKQLSSLYQPHEAPTLMARLKKAMGPKQPAAAAPAAGAPVLHPGMTLDEVLAAGSPVPKQPTAGKLIGKPFPEGDKWYQIEEDDTGNLTRKVLPGYTEQTRLQELIRQGYTEDEAKKVMRIESGLEAKAVATRKGFKYDPQTDEVVDQDTQERWTRDDVANGRAGETVARMFAGQAKQEKRKAEIEDKKFKNRISAMDHAFTLAVQRNDHSAANRYIASAKNDLVQAQGRMATMDQNEKDALAGNQQAMLSLVANHIGMTLGAQKGARITRAVWEEAIESASWLDQKISKWFHTDENGDHIFDGYKGGVTLTRAQIEQMVALAHQKVDTLKDQVANMQTTFQKELGTGTPAGGGTANPNAPPAAPVLNDEEKKIQQLLNGGGPQ